MSLKTMTKQQLIEQIEQLQTVNKTLEQEVYALSEGDVGKLKEELEKVKDQLCDTKDELEELQNSVDEDRERDTKAIEEVIEDFDQFVKEFNRFISGESCPNHIKELEYLTKSIEDLNAIF